MSWDQGLNEIAVQLCLCTASQAEPISDLKQDFQIFQLLMQCLTAPSTAAEFH